EREGVDAVTESIALERATTRSRCGQGHVLIPHLLYQGIHSDVEWIKGGNVVSGTRRGIVEDAVAHVGAGHEFEDGLRVRPARALVVEEEVGFAAKDFFGDDGSPNGSAKPVSVPVGYPDGGVIVLPGVGGKIIVQVILVSRTVPGVGAALGHDLHLHA